MERDCTFSKSLNAHMVKLAVKLKKAEHYSTGEMENEPISQNIIEQEAIYV